MPNLSIGMEKVLCAAAADEKFREALLEDPRVAVETRGLPLRASELEMLCRIPREQLKTSIDNIDVSPQNVQRRTFMRAVAATAATVVAAETLYACNGDGNDTGARPDMPPQQPDGGLLDADPSRGTRPD